MSKTDPEREGRLARELRENLRRRKADGAGPLPPPVVEPGLDPDDLARDGPEDSAQPPDEHVPGRDDGDRPRNPAPQLPPD